MPFGTRSDNPAPRLSNQIGLANDDNHPRNRAIVGSSHANSTWDTQPGT